MDQVCDLKKSDGPNTGQYDIWKKGSGRSVHFPLVCTDLIKFSVVQFNTVLKTAQKQNKKKKVNSFLT